MSNDFLLDDNGLPITDPDIIKIFEERFRIPDDLRFPFMTNKMSGSREPHKTQWMLSYLVYRTAVPKPTDEQCKEYYKRIQVDCDDDINRFRGALLLSLIHISEPTRPY